MAVSINRVLLAGNLTRDPQVRVFGADRSVCQFSLAINRRFKSADGEQREEVTFVDCEAWGRTAELVGQYLTKGSPVFVEGRLHLDQWEDKDGAKRSRLKVVVDSVQFLPSGRDRSGGGEGDEGAPEPRRSDEGRRSTQRPAAAPGAGPAAAPAAGPGADDEPPF